MALRSGRSFSHPRSLCRPAASARRDVHLRPSCAHRRGSRLWQRRRVFCVARETCSVRHQSLPAAFPSLCKSSCPERHSHPRFHRAFSSFCSARPPVQTSSSHQSAATSYADHRVTILKLIHQANDAPHGPRNIPVGNEHQASHSGTHRPALQSVAHGTTAALMVDLTHYAQMLTDRYRVTAGRDITQP